MKISSSKIDLENGDVLINELEGQLEVING